MVPLPGMLILGRVAGQGGIFEVKPWTSPPWHWRNTVPTVGQAQAEVGTGLTLVKK